MDLRQRLATNMRQRRERAGRTPAQMAEAAGCSEIAWRKWEAAERWPGPDQLARIASVLSVEVSTLFR